MEKRCLPIAANHKVPMNCSYTEVLMAIICTAGIEANGGEQKELLGEYEYIYKYKYRIHMQIQIHM